MSFKNLSATWQVILLEDIFFVLEFSYKMIHKYNTHSHEQGKLLEIFPCSENTGNINI